MTIRGVLQRRSSNISIHAPRRAAPKTAVTECIVPAACSGCVLGLRRAFDAVEDLAEDLLDGDEAEHDTAAMFSHLP